MLAPLLMSLVAMESSLYAYENPIIKLPKVFHSCEQRTDDAGRTARVTSAPFSVSKKKILRNLMRKRNEERLSRST
jgi:hypothetical protein